MSTLIPEELRVQIEGEISEMISVRPHNPDAKIAVRLDSQFLALLMLTSHETKACNAEFTKWTKDGGLSALEREDRKKFAIGMLAAGRLDVVRFLENRLSLEIDLKNADITEATALQLVVTIMGNMIMQSLQMKREAENKKGV